MKMGMVEFRGNKMAFKESGSELKGLMEGI